MDKQSETRNGARQERFLFRDSVFAGGAEVPGPACAATNNRLVTERIPCRASRTQWKQALADHHNYWAWRRDRNEARWQQQERGELDFDSKNMMHTVRLLLSGKSLMKFGRPIVRFTGDDLSLLMSIREGRLSFDEIMSIAQDILTDCERVKATADLPDVCNVTQANALLWEVTEHWERRVS